MTDFQAKTTFDKVFEGGLLIKGLDGFFEFLGGLLLFVFTPDQIHRFAVFLTHTELLEDPHSKISHLLLSSTQHFSNGSRVFLIFYLWLHAAIKLIAVIGILKNMLWAYPFSLISLGALMLYQVYSIFFVKASFGMIGLTIFDVFILGMITVEYKKVKTKLQQKSA
jgi:uncharacterized membrane protein